MLGLPYPGGPEIDRLASSGDPQFHDFPRAQLEDLDFSFSGVKTSVLYYLNRHGDEGRRELLEQHIDDICASFQAAVVDMLMTQLSRAVEATGVDRIAVVGGVSANRALRDAASEYCSRQGLDLFIPKPEYCTDNAAMIATAAYHKLKAGITSPLTLTADANASF